MKGNRMIKIIKKYQRMYGEDPEILFKGVFGYSDIEISSLTDRDEGGRDSRGRAVCVIEGYGQGRSYPTLALDEIERERALGDTHPDNDAHILSNGITTLRSDARIQQNSHGSVNVGIPDDISAYVRERTESIINHRIMHPEYYANTQEGTQENSN